MRKSAHPPLDETYIVTREQLLDIIAIARGGTTHASVLRELAGKLTVVKPCVLPRGFEQPGTWKEIR